MIKVDRAQPKPPGRTTAVDWYGPRSSTLSYRQFLGNMARFYAPAFTSYFYTNWSVDDMNSTGSAFRSVGDVAAWVKAYRLPDKIRQQATVGAQRLYGAFDLVAHHKMVGDQVTGRLDRRKFPALAQAVVKGYGAVEDIRPYRRLEYAPAKKPLVAFVVDANNASMWSDAGYIPKVATLALALQWAGEAAGVDVVAALVAAARPNGIYQAQIGYVLRDNEHPAPPLSAYGVLMNRDAWRVGIMVGASADAAAHKQFVVARGKSMGMDATSTDYPSRDGGNAVAWAREIYHADYVVSVGNILDAEDADVSMSGDVDVAEAISHIARSITKR